MARERRRERRLDGRPTDGGSVTDEWTEDVTYPDADADPTTELYQSDARDIPLTDDSVDLVVTSPPYYEQREYGLDGEIGHESSVEEYVRELVLALNEWGRVLRERGSMFVNVGDVYDDYSLQTIPQMFARRARGFGWNVRNVITWVKDGGMPDAAQNRLSAHTECVLHLTRGDDYYYDLHGYAHTYGNGSNPGDVWTFGFDRNTDGHLAPFPEELPRRALTLAAPHVVCVSCGEPRRRELCRTDELDPSRPQARRAMEIYEESDLTFEHVRAIQSKGITDVGKAKETQTGSGRNASDVEELAAEAKDVLGSYYREFTYAKKKTCGWTDCDCDAPTRPSVVLDPFVGTGTTVAVAQQMGLSAIGCDLQIEHARDATNVVAQRTVEA